MASRKSLKKLTLLRSISVSVVFFCLLVFISSVAPAAGAEKETIPSYGQRPPRGPHLLGLLLPALPGTGAEARAGSRCTLQTGQCEDPLRGHAHAQGDTAVCQVLPLCRQGDPGLQVSHAGQTGSLRTGGERKCLLDGREDRGGVPEGKGRLYALRLPHRPARAQPADPRAPGGLHADLCDHLFG